MTELEFWGVVDQTKDVPIDRRLTSFLRALGRLPNDQVIDFLAFFSLFRALLDRRDIKEVSWLLSGGMGDDSFIDFRDCAVTYGRDVYRRLYMDAQSLLEDDRTLDFTGESFYGRAYDALRTRLGLSDARLSLPPQRRQGQSTSSTSKPFADAIRGCMQSWRDEGKRDVVVRVGGRTGR
ncbi:MAG: DUF4240 domain-containing protein [Myxococcales bacterium]|nr:DUF4240 domain-containing protein [Myxococcales bacterium]